MSADGDRNSAFQACQQHQSNSSHQSDQTNTTASDKVATAPKRQHFAFSTPQDEALASDAADVQDNNDDGVATPLVKSTARSMQPRLHPSSINKVNTQIRANATDNLHYAISQRDEATEKRIAKLDDQCATLGAIFQSVLVLKDEWQTKLDTLSAAGQGPDNYKKAFEQWQDGHDTITEGIAALAEASTADEARLGELEEQVKEMVGKVGHGSNNADSGSSFNAAATLLRLTRLETRMTAMEEAVESSSSKSSSAMEKRMASMEGQMTALANTVKTLQAKMTSRDTTIHEQTIAINEYSPTIDWQTKKIKEQNTMIASQNNTIASLESKFDQKVEDFKRWFMTGS